MRAGKVRQHSWLDQLVGWGLFWMAAAVWMFAILQITSCASGPDKKLYPEQELLYQRLKFRPGYEGKLTYSVCLAKDASSGECTSEQIRAFDLADPATRKTFNDLGFICRVGDKRGKVCQDSAGICSITYTQSCPFPWCAKTEVVAHRWDATTDFIFLVGAGTRCFNVSQYPLGS